MSQGMISKLAVHSASPAIAGTRIDFLSASIAKRQEHFDGNGMRGELDHDISRNREGLARISGTIVTNPNVVEMALLLPWILGGTPTGSGTVTYPLASTALTRYVMADKNLGTGALRTYDTVGVDRAVFSAEQGGALTLALDVVGKDETVSGNFPSIDIDTASGPWMFHELVLTLNSVTVTPKNFNLTIDNFLDKERFFNSQTLSAVKWQDRAMGLNCMVPAGDFQALYDAGGEDGVTGTAVFTQGSNILTFTFGRVALPGEDTVVEGRVENMMPLNGKIFKSGATAALVTTIQS